MSLPDIGPVTWPTFRGGRPLNLPKMDSEACPVGVAPIPRTNVSARGIAKSLGLGTVENVVADPGPDWSTLGLWNSFTPNTDNGVPGEFSGWSQTGGVFTVYLDDRSLGGGSSDIEGGEFYINYTGPGHNCLATVDMSQWGGATADADAAGIFEVVQDGTVIATGTMTNYDRTISGSTLLVPFTLAPGTGSLIIFRGGYNLLGITEGWIVAFLNEAVRFQITVTLSNL